ncbi:retrovirus-related Pol polyprotein from transposon 17.6 [Trichonephila clavipes]|uniref:RNA-directed DNA polymerase n=1 Tax=Trichonephila clavipes TaxID=2585209 RepID=A0A8X6RZL7_TRICX|nr:retrovirus-related Pol polyprotein from transposon 17.6 [Trichonephila clavipes]
MSTLNDYPKISQSLKSSSTNNIKILHRLIFGESSDRKNRSRLREFSGFPTDFNVEETKTKIIKEFTLKELIAVCNLLHLEFTTELESCCDIILTHLCDLTLFKSTVLNSGSESDLELNEKSPPENHHSQPITSDSANKRFRDYENSTSNQHRIEHKRFTNQQPICYLCGLKGHKSTLCPNKERGKKCYGCKTFGHVQAECSKNSRKITPITNHKINTQVDRTVNSISILTPPKNLMHVEITISKIPITALCDTGSQATIINEKTYQKLGYPTLSPSQCTFSGIGRDRVESKGYFKNFITIQNTALPAKIHVVNDETIPLDAIIEIDFLQQTKFTFGRDGIRIFRDVDECKNDDVLVNLANLFDEQQCKLDLPHISNSKIQFLGYIIENGTIKHSPSKTQAVQNFPQPQTPRQLQSFIGLTSYFRKFIPNYARIARPLSDLLRDNVKFKFGPTEIASFQELKNILSENPVLHVFQQGYPLELHTDASSLGFGAVLLEKSDDGLFHPIHYFSRKTTVQQEKYSSYELEVLAIIEALRKFRSYLLGTKFKIITDCDAFQKTMHKKDLPAKIARWALMLEEFDYEVCHRPGRQIKQDDALSP